VDEWIEDYKASIDTFNGSEETGKVFRERERTMAGGLMRRRLRLNEREDFDAREIGPQSGQKLELGRRRSGVGSDDDDPALKGWGAVGHRGAG
jgi:hypothetical protein